MCASIRWIKMLAQTQFLIKNSDPPSNSDTRGRRNSQNKWTPNGDTSCQLNSFLQHTVIICASRDPQCMTFRPQINKLGWAEIHFVKKKSNRDGPWRLFQKRRDSIPKVKGFQYKLKSGLDEIQKAETFWNFLKLFEQMNFFESKGGPKKWQHIMKHNFFSSSPLGLPVEPGTVHMYTRVHASAFLQARPRK